MRKQYPYLQEQYVYNLNEEQTKRNFLEQLDDFVNQRQYVQMTLLDWEENPLKDIQGIIIGGSLSKDGASPVRTTGSLSCTVSADEYNIDSLNMDFALNKKVFIEIGIKNETDQYQDWPILWFPQGIFLITDFSMNSSSTSAVNLTISLKDKMCLLNGDIGGKLPATVRFDMMDTQLPNGEWTQQKVLIYNIILELVNHYGNVPISNIIIQDVPLRIRQIMQWNGSNNLYSHNQGNSETEGGGWIYTTEKPDEEVGSFNTYTTGEDVGYIYRDFVVAEELVGAAGSTITSILDQIKNILGNYEYFFNEFGVFIFREIKNYLNITQAQVVEEEMNNPGRRIKFNGGNFLLDEQSENQYLIETTNEKTLYSFNDDKNITSITVTPQYGNIKNDYIVEGLRQGTSSDEKYTVRYHLAIDEKPQIVGKHNGIPYYGKYENVVYFTDTRENDIKQVNRLGIVKDYKQLPDIGNFDQLYYVDNECFYWDGTVYKTLVLITQDDEGNDIENPVIPQDYYAQDWRTFLYLYGLQAEANGVNNEYNENRSYYQELNAFWPLEYCLDPENQHFFGEEKDVIRYGLTEGNYFLDFIDANSATLGEYSVSAIGRRQEVVVDDKVNCLFVPEIPNVIFLNKDNPQDNWTENTTGIVTEEELNDRYEDMLRQQGEPITKKIKNETGEETVIRIAETLPIEAKLLGLQRNECELNTQPWTQVDNEIFSNLTIGGYKNSAYEVIRYELFCHTRYQKTVSITSIPVFYLAPNSRVKLSSGSTNIYGDFMVQNINLSFGPGANMSVVLNEVAERL